MPNHLGIVKLDTVIPKNNVSYVLETYMRITYMYNGRLLDNIAGIDNILFVKLFQYLLNEVQRRRNDTLGTQ